MPAHVSTRPLAMAANFDWKARPEKTIELWTVAANKMNIAVASFFEEFSPDFRLWAQVKPNYQQKIGSKIRKERQNVWGPMKVHGQEYGDIPRGTKISILRPPGVS